MTFPDNDLARVIREAAEADRPKDRVSPDENRDLGIDLEEHRIWFEVKVLQDQLGQIQKNHDLRVSYTGRIFWLVVGWLVGVVLCVMLAGFGGWGFRLSDAVLVAFITSTTVNVVGLFVLVAKWMYPSGSADTQHKDLISSSLSMRSKPKH